ncbi:RluA family pseudouridine synthase [Gorillibacterium sp. sgz5001074]|uniref:RluA family pseudouridine synthase n=1 Tax=Gorillibacterium sp. sgz5001074 TaxID=3446695 RepID=UPI003F674D09
MDQRSNNNKRTPQRSIRSKKPNGAADERGDRSSPKSPPAPRGGRGTKPGRGVPGAKPEQPAARNRGGSPKQDPAPGARDTRGPKPNRSQPDTVLTSTEPTELLELLLSRLPGGRNHVKAILSRGQVSVAGRPTTKFDYPVLPGQQVTVSWTKTFEAEILRGVHILHEDPHLLVVEKEAGLLSIASEQEKAETAYAMLTAYVRRTHPKNRIYVVHRLDRDTSGVMLYAKSEEVQQALQNAWNEAVEARTYVALVEGAVRKPEGTITSWLKESKTLKMYSSPYPNDGQKAVTHYKVLKAGRDFSLLELELETGRKNQIRVHMEDIGHPIVGDKKYGSRTSPIGRLGLHAQAIAFHHPITGELLRFETKIPKSFTKTVDQP